MFTTTECPGEGVVTSLRVVTFKLCDLDVSDYSDLVCIGVKDIAYNSDGRFVLTLANNSKKIVPSGYVLVEDSAPDWAVSTLSVESATPRGEVLLLSRAVTDEEITLLVYLDGGVYKLNEENTGRWFLTGELSAFSNEYRPWPENDSDRCFLGMAQETLNTLAKFLSANSCFKY